MGMTASGKPITKTQQEEGNLFFSSMSTNDDMSATTPLQMANYLTMKQREILGPSRETQPAEGNLLSSSMFTKEDIEAITPLQIANYLTLKEREKIGTKVLCSKLKKGFLADDEEVCDTCSMPKLSKEGRTAEKCAICPVLKKRVLKKIMSGCC